MTPKLDLSSRVGVFLLRLWVGLNFMLVHGLEKVQDPDLFLEAAEMRRFAWYRHLGWGVIAAQFFGGVLMTIGLQVRVAAAALLATMGGAAYVTHLESQLERREFALTYAAICLLFVLHGAGSFSVDEWLERKRRKASPW